MMSAATSTSKKAKITRVVKKQTGPAIGGGSPEAKRLAAVVLEVLAGGIRPSDGAASLGISTPRYYVLELRALQGLLAACEPKPPGSWQRAEGQLRALRKKCSRLERERIRYQSLARAAQRALGLSVTDKAGEEDRPSGKGRRRRRPTARALKAAKRLRASLPAPEGQDEAARAGGELNGRQTGGAK